MTDEYSECNFCKRKIGLDDSFYESENGIFCDGVCMKRFEMGENDKCKNCNKKIIGELLQAKEGKKNGIYFYFCSEKCFAIYNKKYSNNQLVFKSHVAGGNWGQF